MYPLAAYKSHAGRRREADIKKLQLLGLSSIQQSNAMKVLDGREFSTLDCSQCATPEDVFATTKDKPAPLVVLMTVKLNNFADGAKVIDGNISIVIENSDNASRFKGKVALATKEAQRIFNIEQNKEDNSKLPGLFSAIPEALAKKYGIEEGNLRDKSEQLRLLYDALKLVHTLAISKSTGTLPIEEWAKKTSDKQHEEVAGLADIYCGAKLHNLTELACQIAKPIIEAQRAEAALARKKLLEKVTSPAGKWIAGLSVGGVAATVLAACWGLSYGSDPTRHANEEELARLVSRVGIKNLHIPNGPINVKLKHYAGGQIAEVTISSIEEGSYEGGVSSKYYMSLKTKLGETSFTAFLTEKEQANSKGFLSIQDARDVNKGNIHLCSESASRAIEWIALGSATPDYKAAEK